MNRSPFSRGNRGLWLRLGGTLLAVALLVLLVRQQSWAEIIAAFASLSTADLLLALGLTLLSRTAVTLRWHLLLRASDSPPPFGQSLRLTFAMLFASNFLPTTIGGDVVRLAGALQLRMDAALATASLVADRLVGMAGMGLLLPVGLERVFAVGLPALTAPESRAPGLLAGGLTGRLGGLWRKAREFLRRLGQNLALWARRPGWLLLALGATLLHQACLYTSIWILLRGMGQTIGWLQIAGIWSLVYFITLLPVSISGYGLQEMSTTLLYARLGGISTESAVAVALLVRTLQIAASLPGAIFVPGILAARREDAQ